MIRNLADSKGREFLYNQSNEVT